ncbi:MAG: ankyrin repeat domain-containing protein [Planctomycetota bacterium]|nr:ankyrin repeat domain-containing protein [Planctomycetota bacterium]
MNTRTALTISLISLATLGTGCNNGGAKPAATGTSSAVKVPASSNLWFVAATTGTQADLDAALKSGHDVNAHESRDRNTPLHIAAMAGNVNAVNFILSNGGKIDAVDEDGRTALMMCLHRNQGPAALALVKANANLELGDRERKTALMFACISGQLEVVNAMIARNVNINAQRKNGTTALHFAADKGHLDIARALMAAKADTSLRDRSGRTALDFAILRSNPEMATIIRGS